MSRTRSAIVFGTAAVIVLLLMTSVLFQTSAPTEVDGGASPKPSEQRDHHAATSTPVATDVAIGANASGGGAADDEEARLQRTDVAGACFPLSEKQWWRPARCPSDEWWLEPWVKMRGGQAWTLVAVGANKGYGLTSWMEHLVGTERTPYNARRLGIHLFNTTRQFGTMSHCGGCCECVDAPIHVRKEHAAARVRVIAFEPGPATARHLRTFFDDRDTFDIRWKAVSDRNGRAFFPDVPLGKETGQLVADNTSAGRAALAAGNAKFNLSTVDVVALDDELQPLYRPLPDARKAAADGGAEETDASPPSASSPAGIDILQTDVEGFDQDVARGARKLLASGKVGVYIFEMNRAENYTQVFGWLHAEAGFECYFGTERRFVQSTRWRHLPPFVRITGRCWRPEYETYSGWINAVCVHRERAKELLPVMGRLTRMRRKMMMTCAGKKRQQKVVGRFLSRYLAAEQREYQKEQDAKN